MGLGLNFAGRALDMDSSPTSADLLAMMAERGRVSLDDLLAAPHGVTAERSPLLVAPARPGADERLQLMPADVQAELAPHWLAAEPVSRREAIPCNWRFVACAR
jgi:hypothetical protein